MRSLGGIVLIARDLDKFDDREARDKVVEEYELKFGKISDRIERKRQEIQSLSDGVGLL